MLNLIASRPPLTSYLDASIKSTFNPEEYAFPLSDGYEFAVRRGGWVSHTGPLLEIIDLLARPQATRYPLVLAGIAGERLRKGSIYAYTGLTMDIDPSISCSALDAAISQFGHLAVRHTIRSSKKKRITFERDTVEKWAAKYAPCESIESQDVLKRFITTANWDDWLPVPSDVVSGASPNPLCVLVYRPVISQRVIFPFHDPYDIDFAYRASAHAAWPRHVQALAAHLKLPLTAGGAEGHPVVDFPGVGQDLEIALWGGEALGVSGPVRVDLQSLHLRYERRQAAVQRATNTN